MPNSSATLSAVSGIESVPNFSRIAGLTNRQPMVVSWISVDRENADVALGMTNGARLMLSTPPASTRSASPERTAREAMAIASRLDPQSRFTVPPGAETGSPASSVAIRATLRLSSPAWLAQPISTSSSSVPVHRRQPAGELAEHVGGQVVRADGGQCAAVPAERGPHPGHQERLYCLSIRVMTHP